MKRPLWSILTAAVAAVLPGMTGLTAIDAVAAPIPEAAKPAPEAVQVRRPEIQHEERQLDDLDENPAPAIDLVAVGPMAPRRPVVSTISAVPAAPHVALLARRSLGRPRVRAPDRIV